jgi:hypothetical protein
MRDRGIIVAKAVRPYEWIIFTSLSIGVGALCKREFPIPNLSGGLINGRNSSIQTVPF